MCGKSWSSTLGTRGRRERGRENCGRGDRGALTKPISGAGSLGHNLAKDHNQCGRRKKSHQTCNRSNLNLSISILLVGIPDVMSASKIDSIAFTATFPVTLEFNLQPQSTWLPRSSLSDLLSRLYFSDRVAGSFNLWTYRAEEYKAANFHEIEWARSLWHTFFRPQYHLQLRSDTPSKGQSIPFDPGMRFRFCSLAVCFGDYNVTRCANVELCHLTL